MSYDTKLERDLLEVIRGFPHDLESPSDTFHPMYPDSIGFVPRLSRYMHLGPQAQWRAMESHLKAMIERGWLTGEKTSWLSGEALEKYGESWGPLALTDLGHQRLEALERQDLSNRIPRFLGSLAGAVSTGVVLPVIVSILTVLALQHLGLGP